MNLNAIEGNIRAIQDRVIVSDMDFGEQKTKSGIIITGDDGKVRGVRPRWAKVYRKGPRNNDDYQEGDWILIEHGRWTRGIKVYDESGEKIIRMVEKDSILAYTNEKPNEVELGNEYANGDSTDINPQDFMR